MKKETTNTFEGGLIKDLHPLTTPNNVLTDALNATLITYNGNENILLNDMGNCKIDTAKLPAGYVPVGMKEHGGIVYVAAYNPETGKGQVGSFPSPLLLWKDEEWSVNSPSSSIITPKISRDSFYEFDGNLATFLIKNEIVKQELFKTLDGTAKIFHPGDKFIIGFPAKGNVITDVTAGYVSIQLGVIKSDGGIEIMRTWSKDNPDGSFLYGENVSGEDLKALLTNKNVVLVFDASSSGSMILIITLHTLDTFNLFREYELIEVTEEVGGVSQKVEKIKVTFTGEATRNGEVLKSNGNFLGLIDAPLTVNGGLKSETHGPIEKMAASGSSTYTIYPTVPFGIVNRMKKEVTINYSKIRKDEDSFGEWRFFVTDTYVKIGWAYDFYNLKKDKEIEYIKMYFHRLLDGYDRTHGNNVKSFVFLKESYNGNFEDYISISDVGLTPKTVYIVEIVKKFVGDNDEKIICFKMLYLSKLYNSKYNNFFDNKSIGLNGEDSSLLDDTLYTCFDNQTVGLELKYELVSDLEGCRVKVKGPKDGALLTLDYINLVDLNSSYYATDMNAEEYAALADANRHYITKLKNTYHCTVKVTASLTGNLDDYIGTPNEDAIVERVLKACTLDSKSINYKSPNNRLEYKKSTESYPASEYDTPGFASGEDYIPTLTVQNKVLSISNLLPSDYRFISGKISDLKNTTYLSSGLRPLLSNDYTADRKNKIAPYWNTTEPRCISGDADGRKTIFYNSKLGENGQVFEGPDAGGGIDDGGLQTASNYMDNPMTNIFVGMNGQDAEMEFKDLKKNTDKQLLVADFGLNTQLEDFDGNNNGHFLKYQSDNYAIACWKFTDGLTHFVNLVTAKTIGDRKADNNYPRLDTILKCLLSQIFVVTPITKTASYVTTDDKFYAWQEGETEIHFVLEYHPNHIPDGAPQNTPTVSLMLNDIMYEGNSTLLKHLRDKWGWTINGENETINIGTLQDPLIYPFKNLIPTIGVTLPFNSNNKKQIDLDLPNYYDIDSLLGYYMGVTYNRTSNEDDNYNIQEIYLLDHSALNENKALCTSGNGTVIKARADGMVTWSGTPKCVPLASDNKDLYIYKWNNASDTRIKFDNFYDHFKTRAKLDLWVDIEENTDNELLAIPGSYTIGKWTNAAEDHAPDIFYEVLYSSDISILKKTLG